MKDIFRFPPSRVELHLNPYTASLLKRVSVRAVPSIDYVLLTMCTLAWANVDSRFAVVAGLASRRIAYLLSVSLSIPKEANPLSIHVLHHAIR